MIVLGSADESNLAYSWKDSPAYKLGTIYALGANSTSVSVSAVIFQLLNAGRIAFFSTLITLFWNDSPSTTISQTPLPDFAKLRMMSASAPLPMPNACNRALCTLLLQILYSAYAFSTPPSLMRNMFLGSVGVVLKIHSRGPYSLFPHMSALKVRMSFTALLTFSYV